MVSGRVCRKKGQAGSGQGRVWAELIVGQVGYGSGRVCRKKGQVGGGQGRVWAELIRAILGVGQVGCRPDGGGRGHRSKKGTAKPCHTLPCTCCG